MIARDEWEPVRFVQIEVTTHCNMACFYCAGRAMSQRHIAFDLFEAILARLPKRPLTVSLQGEGEPFLHPRFWDLVARVQESGHTPFTITNGSALVDPDRVARAFPHIGVSLDTLDVALAERIGRVQLPRVLRNLERLIECMGPRRIDLYTVDFGQPQEEVRLFAARHRLRHIVQPLQRKEDYRRQYAERVAPVTTAGSQRCRYVDSGFMRYFNAAGVAMPCPFIKDARQYQSIDALRAQFDAGAAPDCCAGCAQLASPTPTRRTARQHSAR
jgi:hypothetical protein